MNPRVQSTKHEPECMASKGPGFYVVVLRTGDFEVLSKGSNLRVISARLEAPGHYALPPTVQYDNSPCSSCCFFLHEFSCSTSDNRRCKLKAPRNHIEVEDPKLGNPTAFRIVVRLGANPAPRSISHLPPLTLTRPCQLFKEWW